MQKHRNSSIRHKDTLDWLSLEDLEYYAEGWALDAEARGKAPGTVRGYRELTNHLLWFLRRAAAPFCGPDELRAFFAYLHTGHREPHGRWEERAGEPLKGSAAKRAIRPLKASTVRGYHTRLTRFFGFVILLGGLDRSPLATFKRPEAQSDQIQPFTREQQLALLDAAGRSRLALRNRALFLFMLDTGARASEVCGVTLRCLDIHTSRCRLRGKGGKERMVSLSPATTRALWALVGRHQISQARREQNRAREDLDQPLFRSQRGNAAGEAITPDGLGVIVRQWGLLAGLSGVRCSPHTFRHTFAVEFLRNGGDVFTLREMLGHTSLVMTNRYVALAQADLDAQHRRFSPVTSLLSKER